LHYQVFRDTLLELYDGRHLDGAKALSAAQALAGHGLAFYAGADAGGSSRLDYYDVRFRQRQSELVQRYGSLIKLGDVLEVASRRSPEASRTGEYDFAVVTRAGAVEYKGRAAVAYSPRDLWTVTSGDLVLSSIDLVKGAVAVAGDDVDGLTMSKEMFAYRLRRGVEASPEYIQILLRSEAAKDMLLGFTTGTSNRTRLESPSQLLDFPLPPLPSLGEQKQKARELRKAYAMQREACTRLDGLLAAAQQAWGPPEPAVRIAERRAAPVAEARALA